MGLMKKNYPLCLMVAILSFFFVFAEDPAPKELTPKQQVEQIDQQIYELNQKQIKYNSKAVKYQDEADRWQFDSNRFNDARYARQQSDKYKAKVNLVRKQIDILNVQKNAILKEHPELSSSNGK